MATWLVGGSGYILVGGGLWWMVGGVMGGGGCGGWWHKSDPIMKDATGEISSLKCH